MRVCMIPLLALILVPCWSAAFDIDTTLHACGIDIVNHINKLLTLHPESRIIPLGRAWVADKFGVALMLDTNDINYIRKHKNKTETDAYYVYANTRVQLNVTMCKLPFSRSLSFYRQSGSTLDDVCFISLGSRIVGKEILHIESDVVGTRFHNTSTNLPCYWSLHFEHPILFHGDYTLEVYTNWIHEFDEPSPLERGRDKSSRVNDGVSKSLNGLGIHPYYIINATKNWYDFSGYVLRGESKSLYFINNNNTKHEFNDGETFLALGFSFGIEKHVPDSFLATFEVGRPLKISEIANATSYRLSLPQPKTYPGDIFSLLNTHVLSNFGSSFYRGESMVFDLPNKISVLRPPSMEVDYSNFTQYSEHYYSLPLCRRGDDIGRWVHNPECIGVDAINSADAINSNECTQGSPPWHQSEGPYDFPLRSRQMVWRPYNCRLGSVSSTVTVGTKLDARTNLENMLGDYKGHYHHSSDSNAPPSTTSQRTSTLRYCLRESRVGLVSGFGDSLGDELRDNFNLLLGGKPDDDSEPAPNIVCQHVQALDDVDQLIKCINDSVYSLFANNSRRDMLKGQRPMKHTQVVLATNFKIQHSVGGLSIRSIEIFFKQQASKHKELEIAFLKDFNITYRRIFYSAIAVNGFRLGGLTPSRQQYTNKLAHDYLVPTGWEVLDAYNMTVGRPDGTWDNTHYRGGVAYAIASVFVNMLCASACELQGSDK